MVNKQYTIHHHHRSHQHNHYSNSNNNNNNNSNNESKFSCNERYSPPPLRESSIISETPNPSSNNNNNNNNTNINTNNNIICSTLTKNFKQKENQLKYDKTKLRTTATTATATLATDRQQHHNHHYQISNNDTDGNYSLYKQNITSILNDEDNMKRELSSSSASASASSSDNNNSTAKSLTINDIGRFQYILQMDKEMSPHSDMLYHIPSGTPTPSNSNTINSKFWKAGSESSMTVSSANLYDDRKKFQKFFENYWKYIKWLLFLMVFFFICGTLLFFIISDQNQENDINSNNMIIGDNSKIYSPSSNYQENFEDNHLNNENDILKISIKNPNISLDENYNDTSKDKNEETNQDIFENDFNVDDVDDVDDDDDGLQQLTTTKKYEEIRTIKLDRNEMITTTIRSIPFRNTQIVRIKSHSGISIDDNDDDDDTNEFLTTTEKLDKDDKTQIDPTKDSVQIIGFTSGHQNNFGVPIEEDERMLKLLNSDLSKNKPNQIENVSYSFATTDSSVFKTKVSPTLPAVFHGDSTVENSSELTITTDVEMCESTSLKICRGILRYDLTTPRKKQFTSTEFEHFKYLFQSNCSRRAAQFVCSVLEPECRPTQMGILQPCKRICKSILEPCASVIASSEILTTTFDCDQYPDSNDRNVCEDPTRRGRCYDNEFKCLDSSCIPSQWRCDNIKDCSLGEDEDNCLFCEQEEFRCQSNDKCIPDKWRCDDYDDCPDRSDEFDCYDYKDDVHSFNNEDELIPARAFSFASIQSPDDSERRSYLTINDEDKLVVDGNDTKKFKSIEDFSYFNNTELLETSANSDNDSDEIQGEASGRIVVIPKNLANFQDSKEIMMTSDSETDFKYSKMNRTKLTTTTATTKTTKTTTTTKPTTEKTDVTTFKANLYCPGNQLRCVSGKCITVSQICDRTIDCPDGADEAMCVYKDK